MLTPLFLAGATEMKAGGCSLREDRLYRVETHRGLFQWVKEEGQGIYSVGMMAVLAALTYPLYSIKVKPVGTKLNFDDNLAVIEAGKRIAAFPTPISGEVVEVNEEVVRDPERVNRRPYTSWIAKLRATRPEEIGNLKRAEEVREVVERFVVEEDVDCSIVKE
ncbi:MAG: glycine cleavage system protein H [Aquificota bacterium]|nr:glycine cleavage system protein H [Aquificota bacterium]